MKPDFRVLISSLRWYLFIDSLSLNNRYRISSSLVRTNLRFVICDQGGCILYCILEVSIYLILSFGFWCSSSSLSGARIPLRFFFVPSL